MNRSLFLCLWISTSVFATRRVVVVGGGLAGYCAAIEAYRAGAHVMLLEKEPKTGGNSLKASSGMNALDTPPQVRDGVHDSVALFVQDTLRSGHGKSDTLLADILAQHSTAAWHFLAEFGVKLDLLCKSGGHCRARTHRTDAEQRPMVSNVGRDIMHALAAYVDSVHDARLQVWLDTVVTQLLTEHEAIAGVRVLCKGVSQDLPADAVVLATGGFCGQTAPGSMLVQYAPHLAHLSTTNGAFATGDGVALGQAAGAQLVDMDQIQIHPTGFVDPHAPAELRKFLAPESLRACGGLLLNQHGQRFVNELATRDSVTQAIMSACAPYINYAGERGPISAYLALNEAGVQLFSPKMMAFYERFGLVHKLPNAQALADFIGVAHKNVIDEFHRYAQEAHDGRDRFGKTTFPIIFTIADPVYVMVVTPCLHYCMGGLKFDANACVLGAQGAIKGLYAAGEVTGGLHGANRLCGNSLLECVVFGCIAGRNAASIV